MLPHDKALTEGKISLQEHAHQESNFRARERDVAGKFLMIGFGIFLIGLVVALIVTLAGVQIPDWVGIVFATIVAIPIGIGFVSAGTNQDSFPHY